jgi:hypothetical protein
MSYYRIGKVKNGQQEPIEHMNFDNKEDAEHSAKNKSTDDSSHFYVVQKNEQGEFITIKTYQQGQII